MAKTPCWVEVRARAPCRCRWCLPTLGTLCYVVYSRAWTAAMQGGFNVSTPYRIVTSVAKHLATYGGPESGAVDRFAFDAELDERTWRTTFLPAFRGSAEAGVDGFMCRRVISWFHLTESACSRRVPHACIFITAPCSYSATNITDDPAAGHNTPDCANGYLLNTVARGKCLRVCIL